MNLDLDNWTFIFDFDGTVSPDDMGHVILDTLGRPEWRTIDARWINGEISTSRRAREQFALVDASEAELESLIARHAVDPEFPALVRELRAAGAEFEIVSDGFDFYVGRMLHAAGLDDLAFTANHLEFRDGAIVLGFPNAGADGEARAGWKAVHVRRAMAAGRRVAYVGDGHSDVDAAPLAQLIFATSHLAAHCEAAGIAYHPFESLTDVRAWLRTHAPDFAPR